MPVAGCEVPPGAHCRGAGLGEAAERACLRAEALDDAERWVAEWYRMLDLVPALAGHDLHGRPSVQVMERPAWVPEAWSGAPDEPPFTDLTTSSGTQLTCGDDLTPACDVDPVGAIAVYDDYAWRGETWRKTVVIHELEHANFMALDELRTMCASAECNEIATYLRAYDTVASVPEVQAWLAPAIPCDLASSGWRDDPLQTFREVTAFRLGRYVREGSHPSRFITTRWMLRQLKQMLRSPEARDLMDEVAGPVDDPG